MIAFALRVSGCLAALLLLAGVAVLLRSMPARQPEAPSEPAWQPLQVPGPLNIAQTAPARDPSWAGAVCVGTASPDGLRTSHHRGPAGLSHGCLAGKPIHAILPLVHGGGPAIAGAAGGLSASADHSETWSPVPQVPIATSQALRAGM